MNPNIQFYKFEDFVADESFQRWTKSTATPDEARFWSEWYHRHPEKQKLIDQAKASVLELSRTESEVDQATVQHSWEQLEKKIRTPERQIPVFRWMGYAAAVAAVVLGAFWLIDSTEEAEFITYQSDYGQKKEIILPDGSQVILNANSAVKTYFNWDDQEREIWLEKGEAFFKITKTTSSSSFTAHTGNLEVKVLGTEFNINRRTNETRVLLTEGKIMLAFKGEERVMSPGELAVLSRSGKISVSNVDISRHDSWLRNKIVFHNSSLEEVSDLMKTHYGVEVDLAEDLEQRTISGEIPNDNLGLLLEALEVTLDIKITQTNNKVIISQ